MKDESTRKVKRRMQKEEIEEEKVVVKSIVRKREIEGRMINRVGMKEKGGEECISYFHREALLLLSPICHLTPT